MSDASGSVLSISIVVYCPDAAWLTTTLESLVAALAHARHAGAMRRARIFLVDNQSDAADSPFTAQLENAGRQFGWIETVTIAGHGKILEIGTHAALIANAGVYASLHRLQFENV